MPLLCMYMSARGQRVGWVPLLYARWLGVWAEVNKGARWRLCACLTVCVSPGSATDPSLCLCARSPHGLTSLLNTPILLLSCWESRARPVIGIVLARTHRETEGQSARQRTGQRLTESELSLNLPLKIQSLKMQSLLHSITPLLALHHLLNSLFMRHVVLQSIEPHFLTGLWARVRVHSSSVLCAARHYTRAEPASSICDSVFRSPSTLLSLSPSQNLLSFSPFPFSPSDSDFAYQDGLVLLCRGVGR